MQSQKWTYTHIHYLHNPMYKHRDQMSSKEKVCNKSQVTVRQHKTEGIQIV